MKQCSRCRRTLPLATCFLEPRPRAYRGSRVKVHGNCHLCRLVFLDRVLRVRKWRGEVATARQREQRRHRRAGLVKLVAGMGEYGVEYAGFWRGRYGILWD